MHTSIFSVPKLYTGDQAITVALAFPRMTGGMVSAGSFVGYSLCFDAPNEAEPVTVRGADLYAPAGRDVKPVETLRSLCGFLAAYGEHCRSTATCDHTDSADCPVISYPQSVRDVLHAESERFAMASEPIEYAVCHECACILVNSEGDPDRYDTVGAWFERASAGHVVMARPAECDHPVSYVLPCDACREVGTPFGLHTFTTIR